MNGYDYAMALGGSQSYTVKNMIAFLRLSEGEANANSEKNKNKNKFNMII